MVGRRSLEDDASTHVLEAVIVASVMVASVAYVVTLDVAPVSTDGQRDILQQKTSDALAILNDTPFTSDLGTNLLAVALHECLQNECSRLTSHLDDLMPAGSKYGVYLSTKDGLYPVYAPREPSGESVSSRRAIEPAWSYQFLAVSQSVYNPVEDPVVVYGLPVFSGDLIHQGGSGLSIRVEGTRSDNAAYIMKGSATTRAVDTDDSPLPAATSVFFHAGDGAALATRDVRATTLDISGAASGTPTPFYVRIQESGGGEVPAGSVITIEVPHGWTAVAEVAANEDDWTWISNATDKNGTATDSSISARLLNDVTSGYVDFVFDATYQGDANDYYPFTAALSSGAYAQSQLLVRADEHAAAPAFEVPSISVSVPRPMGVGATTTWTLAAFSSDVVEVDRIVIAEEEGREIFGSITPLTGGGTWTTDGDTLVWTGSATLSHDSPLNLTFRVTASTIGGPASDRAPFVPSVDLSGFDGRLLQEVSPGLYRGIFLPEDASYDGYDTSTGGGLREDHPAQSDAVYRTTDLPGGIDYGVGFVVGLRDSLFGSAVSARNRTVEPNNDAELEIDVQSVMYELAAAGLTPSIDLYVYPPWSGDDRDTVAHVDVYDGTLASGAGTFLDVIDADGDLLPDVTSVGRHNVSVPIEADWLYGPYMTEVRVSWLETLAQTVDGVPLTEEIVRTASVYDYFSVRPTGDALPASPLYDVHLVAWFEDWQ